MTRQPVEMLQVVGDWADQLGAERAPVTRRGEREPISPLLRQLIYRRDRWTCQQCGARPAPGNGKRHSGPLHLDHIIPWSTGGPDTSTNLRVLCGPCNEERSNYVGERTTKPAMPIVRICAPCLSASNERISKLATDSDPSDRFDVFCGSRNHDSWALPGWATL